MSLVFNPTYNPASAYRPVKWLANAGSSNPVEKAVVNIFDSSGIVTTATYNTSYQIGVFYFFEIDIQKICQVLLAPKTGKTSVFGELGQPYAQLNEDCFDQFRIEVNYLERNPTTGLLEDLGVTDVSTFYNVNIVTRQHTEEQSQDDFKPLFLDTNKRFLTNAPLIKTMREGENEFLSFLSDAGAGRIQIQTFEPDGSPVDTGTFDVDINSDFKIQTVGVGYENLRNQVWGTGAVDITLPFLGYYEVSLIGFIDEPYLEVRRYDLVTVCSDLDIRVHWLNLLGGADAYTFTTRNDETITNQNEVARKTLGWDESSATPHNPSDYGKFTYNSFGTKQIVIESDFVSESEARYLTEVKLSNEKYIESNGQLVPFVVSGVETQTKTTSQNVNLIRVSLVIELSNDIIVQSR